MTPRISRLRGCVVVATVAGAVLTFSAAAGHAGVTFRATSAATAVTAQVSNPDQLPLGATAEGSGQTAQAIVDQLGTSVGFASFPYPGGFVLGVPGLVAGVGGPSLPVSNPLYVSSNSETKPKAESAGPGYTLAAASSRSATHASAVGSATDTAQARSGRGSADATSSVAKNGTIAARATTELDNFTVAGIVSFARVNSMVTATRTATGALTRSSSLTLEGACVAGQQIALVDNELVVAGTKQPLAESPLAATLAQAGISLSTVRPSDDPNGRTGGAIVITVSNTNDASSTTRATYRLGSATAFVSFGGSRDDQPLTSSGGSSGNSLFESAPPPAGIGHPSLTTGSGSGPSLGFTPLPTSTEPNISSAAGPSIAGPSIPAPTFGALRAVALDLTPSNPVAWLYFCFVAAGLALLLSTQLIRMYGVKARL